MAGEGSCSWYEFAMEIFRQAEVVTRVMATTTDMMERPAKRPANSVLVSRRSAPIKLPPWQRGLSDYLARRGHTPRRRPRRSQRSSALQRQPMLDWTRREREEREADGEEITGENELPNAIPTTRQPRTPPNRRGPGRGVKLLVAGGAGFIGSNYVRLASMATPETRCGCSTSSPTPAAART